jgi:pimeloyl-ACP methyl ester carboxylesterase
MADQPKKKSGFISNLLTVLLLMVAVVYVFFPGLMVSGLYMLREVSANLEIKTVTVDGQKIVYADNGRKAPAIVLVHGFGANRTSWYGVVKELGRHYRVIVPDMPGFGQSSHLSNASYDISRQAARLDGFFAAVGAANPILVGNSLGGYVSAYYAATRPGKIASLVLIDSAGVTSPELSDLAKFLRQGTNVLIPEHSEDVTLLLQFAYYKPPFIPKPFRRAVGNEMIAAKSWNEKIWRDMEASPRLDSLLTNITAKTLVIWGDHDRIIHPGTAAVFTNGIRGSELLVVSNCGHVPQMERPKETAEAIIGFTGK